MKDDLATMQRIAEANEKLRLALVAKRAVNARIQRTSNVAKVALARFYNARTRANRAKCKAANAMRRDAEHQRSEIDWELARARRWLEVLLLRAK